MTLWHAITWSLLFAAGILAAWAILSDPARGRLRCPGGWRRILYLIPIRQGCWYDMSGVATDGAPSPHRCPECGRLHRTATLSRRRIRWRGLLLAALLILAAYPASVWQRVARHGPWAGVPTWALVSFAPVDEYCRSALGCPFSWAAVPDASRELIMPKWDRPYASWETAILQRRLEAAVDRLRPEFPGRDVGFIPLSAATRERLQNPPSPPPAPGNPPAGMGTLVVPGDEILATFRATTLDIRAGLWVCAGDAERVRAWRALMQTAP